MGHLNQDGLHGCKILETEAPGEFTIDLGGALDFWTVEFGIRSNLFHSSSIKEAPADNWVAGTQESLFEEKVKGLIETSLYCSSSVEGQKS